MFRRKTANRHEWRFEKGILLLYSRGRETTTFLSNRKGRVSRSSRRRCRRKTTSTSRTNFLVGLPRVGKLGVFCTETDGRTSSSTLGRFTNPRRVWSYDTSLLSRRPYCWGVGGITESNLVFPCGR